MTAKYLICGLSGAELCLQFYRLGFPCSWHVDCSLLSTEGAMRLSDVVVNKPPPVKVVLHPTDTLHGAKQCRFSATFVSGEGEQQ
jgi:hypothetical protein